MPDPIERPIFIFMCTPRCGSTWLQRLMLSTNKILVWGEHNLFKRLHIGETFPGDEVWTEDTPVPTRCNLDDLHGFRERGANMWTALLLPPKSSIRRAQKRFLETVFKETAEEIGFNRWGFKVSGWDPSFFHFLTWAWPQCQVVFLTRNLVHACQSHATLKRRKEIVDNWADKTAFAATVARTDVRFCKYEDLLKNGVADLFDWLELPQPDPTVNEVWISTPSGYEAFTDDQKQMLIDHADRINEVNKLVGYPEFDLDRDDRSGDPTINNGKRVNLRRANGEVATIIF